MRSQDRALHYSASRGKNETENTETPASTIKSGREPRELKDAKKLERSDHSEAERRGVEEHVPYHLEVTETQNLQTTTASTTVADCRNSSTRNSYAALARCLVLLQSGPDLNQSLSQLVHVLHFFLVDPILHHSPNLVIYWVEIWAIRRPQIR